MNAFEGYVNTNIELGNTRKAELHNSFGTVFSYIIRTRDKEYNNKRE